MRAFVRCWGWGSSREERGHGQSRRGRQGAERLIITPKDEAEAKQQILAQVTNAAYRATAERMYAELSLAGATMPAFSTLMADAGGHLWAARFRGPGETRRS